MNLLSRVERLERAYPSYTPEQEAELDQLIEREVDRLGVEEAQKVIDEFLKEYNTDEHRDTTTTT